MYNVLYYPLARSCMSGFSDAFYAQVTDRLLAKRLPAKPSYYDTGESCSFWFDPCEVWEITGADLSLSPTHR